MYSPVFAFTSVFSLCLGDNLSIYGLKFLAEPVITMDTHSSSTSIYLEVPDGCEEALPLLDLTLPHFSKTMKRIMKKIEKGEMNIEKPLLSVDQSGQLVPTDFTLVTACGFRMSDMFFIRLANSEGRNEINQLPFVRLSIRKNSDPHVTDQKPAEDFKDSRFLDTSLLQTPLETFKEQLDRLGTFISSLPKTPTPRKPRKKNENTAANQTPAAVDDVKKSVSAAHRNSLGTSNPSVRRPGQKITGILNKKFTRHVDKTISHVLACVESGNDSHFPNYFRFTEEDVRSKFGPPLPPSTPESVHPHSSASSEGDAFEDSFSIESPGLLDSTIPNKRMRTDSPEKKNSALYKTSGNSTPLDISSSSTSKKSKQKQRSPVTWHSSQWVDSSFY
ncbi:unnamed protein product [Calicophoron daubneyi]|uniref:Uncharacterized protein n=1 Tax=Calicophoron daubneyi TaxID=300641 RepID=A0AAV2T2D7_CALDB